MPRTRPAMLSRRRTSALAEVQVQREDDSMRASGMLLIPLLLLADTVPAQGDDSQAAPAANTWVKLDKARIGPRVAFTAVNVPLAAQQGTAGRYEGDGRPRHESNPLSVYNTFGPGWCQDISRLSEYV